MEKKTELNIAADMRGNERVDCPLRTRCYLLALILVACSSSKGGHSLRINSIEVPPAVMNSSQVTLVCNYDLQGDQLYSVKWYKDFVEFYRFQPAEWSSSSSPQSPPLEPLQSEPGELHSKHEFELDGINLILSKSNSSHVYLRQTNLNSEGTYKCEVSADSPSFATISIERQMKVYVLPRQKLSIIDNSALAMTQQQPQQQLGTGEQTISSRQSSSLSLHNINDIVNLTCHSGPSRPAAKLTWLLNEAPISAGSKWLSASTQLHSVSVDASASRQSRAPSSSQLVETKLNLAFRLQPSHLLSNQSQSFGASSRQLQLIRLRCVAKFGVEFTSDASILVSGGKTTVVRKRQEQHQKQTSTTNNKSTSGQPQDSTPSGSLHSKKLVATSGAGQVENLYRWPQPATVQALPAPPSAGRRSSSLEVNWPPSLSAGGDLEPSEAAASVSRSTMLNSRQHNAVWTNRQLRVQADHIDRMLQISQPNELDAPIIVAKILKFDEFPDDASADNNEMGDAEDPIGAQKSALSAISNGELWPDNGADKIRDADQASAYEATTARPAVSQDYELNDIVQFTCFSRTGHPNRADLGKNVYLKWHINNNEINADQINAYDGSKFYFDKPTKLASVSRRLPPARQMESFSGDQETSVAKKDISFNESSGFEESIFEVKKTLQIEFSSSLFQLKEFNLKCRLIVEQPLIEYENQLIASVPSSQYIEVNQKHKPNPTLRTAQRQNGRSGYQQRHRNSKPSSGVPVQVELVLLWPLIVGVTIIRVASLR